MIVRTTAGVPAFIPNAPVVNYIWPSRVVLKKFSAHLYLLNSALQAGVQ